MATATTTHRVQVRPGHYRAVTLPDVPAREAAHSPPCLLRTAATGERRECVSCKGRTTLTVYGCALKGTCTLDQCKGCPSRVGSTPRPVPPAPPEPGVLDIGAGGLGDGVLGMLAAEGLRRSRPELAVSYRCGPTALPYVRLFAGWADARPHHKAHYEGPVPGAAQVNAGYSQEHHHPETRIARYCRNAGAPGPAVPPLADPDGLRARGAPWAGCVLLAPFSTDAGREWPLQNWVALERDLTAAGCRTVVFCGHADGRRCGPFGGEKLIGADAATATAAVLCADLLIGNDSGPAHLAGVLGTSAVALCAGLPGYKVFSAYPSVLPLDGMAALTPPRVQARALEHLWRRVKPHTLQSPDRLQQLARCARETAPLGGAVAELGVFRGGTALLLARRAAGRPLHLFDTFAGIPADDAAPGGKHRAGEFACPEAEVLALLAGHDARTHAGTFPDTAAGLEGERFSLAHLDADTEQSTLAALEWFGPRMVPGGQIVLDDFEWPDCPGVRRALERCGLLGRAERMAAYQCRVRF